MEHVVGVLHVSERRACRAIGHIRSSYRYRPRPNPFREKLRDRVVSLAREYGRYGYKTITSMLRMDFLVFDDDRVQVFGKG